MKVVSESTTYSCSRTFGGCKPRETTFDLNDKVSFVSPSKTLIKYSTPKIQEKWKIILWFEINYMIEIKWWMMKKNDEKNDYMMKLYLFE